MSETAPDSTALPEEFPRARIPAAVDGGTEHVESLGSFFDRLFGDSRQRRRARAAAPVLLEDEHPKDPAPVEPPPAVPDGNEPITKGDPRPHD